MRRTVQVEWQVASAERVRNAPQVGDRPGRSSRGSWLRLARRVPPSSRPEPDGTPLHEQRRRAVPARLSDTRICSVTVTRAGHSPPTTSHNMRHPSASVLLGSGESVDAVAERLGHHNASLVLSTHGHLMPDSNDRTGRPVRPWLVGVDPVSVPSGECRLVTCDDAPALHELN